MAGDFSGRPVTVTICPVSREGYVDVRPYATALDLTDLESLLAFLRMRELTPEETGDANELLPDGTVRSWLALC